MFWLIPIAVIAAAVATVVVTVYLLNRSSLKEVARQQKNRHELGMKIQSLKREGNCNTVNVGLLDSSNRVTRVIEVRGEELEEDFRVGERIVL